MSSCMARGDLLRRFKVGALPDNQVSLYNTIHQFRRNSIGLHQNCIRKITVNTVLETGTRFNTRRVPVFQIPEIPSTSWDKVMIRGGGVGVETTVLNDMF